jgi:hypothetical protein
MPGIDLFTHQGRPSVLHDGLASRSDIQLGRKNPAVRLLGNES